MTEEAKFIRIKTKCLDCGLHFIICTWHSEKHNQDTIHCPECGQHDGNYLVWSEEAEGMISDDVPGDTELDDGIPGMLHLK
jgi:DNA-directed RNA polymerase subunit RPC12/RpoP